MRDLTVKPTWWRDRLGREWFFRSRLEARYAVYLDAHQIDWVYELEKFRLDNQVYIPDFHLPRLCAWLEIKPQPPFEDEREKAWRLAERGQIVLCAAGSCHANDTRIAWIAGVPGTARFLFTECQECQRMGLLLVPHMRIQRPIFICPTTTRHRACWPANERNAAAFQQAQSIRFEDIRSLNGATA